MSLTDKAKNAIKNKAKTKIKKVAIKAIKPFLPFILIIGLLFFAICTIIDAVFIQEVQADSSDMSEIQQELRTKCIEKANYLNTCHNFIGKDPTNNLLDVNNKETGKKVEWSHLYALMTFHNVAEGMDVNESLLNKVAEDFTSTFIYEKNTIKIETTTKDEKGKEKKTTKEETQYLLIESDTIIGHYKYNYEERTTESENTKTTKKVFVNEELIGEQYARLKEHLRSKLNIRESDIETDTQIIIQAATGYSDNKENTGWLQGNSSETEIITDGKGLVAKGMFTWPIPGYTLITSSFGNRIHPIYGGNNFHRGTDISAPVRCKFRCDG